LSTALIQKVRRIKAFLNIPQNWWR